MISSVEYTPDDFGHFNIYGLSEDLPLFDIFSQASGLSDAFQRILAPPRGKKLGGQYHHPFDLECPSSRNFPLSEEAMPTALPLAGTSARGTRPSMFGARGLGKI